MKGDNKKKSNSVISFESTDSQEINDDRKISFKDTTQINQIKNDF